MIDQFRCTEHGHAYYDGDQGAGDPHEDGYHNGRYHDPNWTADWAADWEPWERAEYYRGYAKGADDRTDA
jgi:hypothetical protein